jgi:hypothetical protein
VVFVKEESDVGDVSLRKRGSELRCEADNERRDGGVTGGLDWEKLGNVKGG